MWLIRAERKPERLSYKEAQILRDKTPENKRMGRYRSSGRLMDGDPLEKFEGDESLFVIMTRHFIGHAGQNMSPKPWVDVYTVKEDVALL